MNANKITKADLNEFFTFLLKDHDVNPSGTDFFETDEETIWDLMVEAYRAGLEAARNGISEVEGAWQPTVMNQEDRLVKAGEIWPNRDAVLKVACEYQAANPGTLEARAFNA